MLHIETLISDEQEAGIYTWSLSDDRLYGDSAIAALFGLDPLKTIRGLPLSEYMNRVHLDDREALGIAISEAVKTGQAYYAEYRVKDATKQYVQVMAMGRCFRDVTGKPALYSGIIYPVDQL